ncbi:unnamed protein product [Urochloa decumbens]|uniref:Leucine-rich repeat-containing N-terminal plant-type domain-containing protein n=1 Tax=Urochloa decumbens TaxID=240449 RepID=A0ABC9B201_9POAL
MSPSITLLVLLISAATLFSSSSIAHGPGAPPSQRRATSTGTGNCWPQERDALLEFKKGITGDPAGRLASWHEDKEDCCRWAGVRCSNWTGHVVGLHLRKVRTKDPALHDPSETALEGQISPSLTSLHHLEHLDLSLNNLSGPVGHVPEFIGLLKNLRYLNLSCMALSGRIPPQLGNLSNLHYLDLSLFHYFDSIPYLYTTDISCGTDWELSLSGNYFDSPVASCWLWNLTSLQHLELAETFLHGQVPDVLGHMTSLHVLDFSNSFGTIDIMKANMTSLCNLENLDLTYDSLNGDIIDLLLPNCSTSKLKELHLGGTNLTGVIPDWIGRRWSTLLILELYRNQFAGSVPSGIGMLSNLLILDLSYNEFTGPVLSEIGRLNNLVHIDLSHNQFNGSMPSEIGSLGDLLHLDLSQNRFNGPMPSEIGNLYGLLELNLSQNQLSGPVPSQIGMLSKLTYMDLSNNNLTGVISHEHLGGLKDLTTIDLSGNYLKIMVDPAWSPLFRLDYANFATCEMGPLFPDWLQTQEGIIELKMSRVSIFDKLPDWFFSAFSNARRLDISNNAISGTLTNDLQNMTLLENLYLDSNQLTGAVPRLPTNLMELDISENSFSGPLPPNFGTENLEYLNLASNHFTGPIPHSICQMMFLGQLNLANNYFDGEFPLCIEPGSPQILILRNNRLSGNFPSSLQLWTELYVLDLGWNNFSGRLPLWIGNFNELGILDLSANMFTGSIPATITRLNQLSQLNLAGNMLSGPLPRYLSNLTGMTRAYIPTFSAFTYPRPIRPGHFADFGQIIIFLNGSVVRPMTITHVNLSVITKGQERYYKDGGLYGMVSIDLSSNKLSGSIPEEITSLDGVMNLNLSWNQLSGRIPHKIGAMQKLESLDLKENKIYGKIPQSLSNLTYLSYLDLSYNNLTGTIPSGGQLDTLYEQYPFMYNGNSGLCGHPLKKNCSNSSEPVHGGHGRDEYDPKLLSFSFALVVGFVVGLWVAFCVFLFKKSWRIAYFRLFDVAFDNVYVFVVVICARWAKGATTY